MPVVVGVCHRSHSRMLTRPLLYTAITRARQNCVLVGDGAALAAAVGRDDAGGRHSGLAERLRGAGVVPSSTSDIRPQALAPGAADTSRPPRHVQARPRPPAVLFAALAVAVALPPAGAPAPAPRCDGRSADRTAPPGRPRPVRARGLRPDLARLPPILDGRSAGCPLRRHRRSQARDARLAAARGPHGTVGPTGTYVTAPIPAPRVVDAAAAGAPRAPRPGFAQRALHPAARRAVPPGLRGAVAGITVLGPGKAPSPTTSPPPTRTTAKTSRREEVQLADGPHRHRQGCPRASPARACPKSRPRR